MNLIRQAVRQLVAELRNNRVRELASDCTEVVLDAIAHNTVVEVELRRIANKIAADPKGADRSVEIMACADRLKGLNTRYAFAFRKAPKEKISVLIQQATRQVMDTVNAATVRGAAEIVKQKIRDGDL